MSGARTRSRSRGGDELDPLERFQRISRAAGFTVNDVVLTVCAGALRAYLLEQDALPGQPLIAISYQRTRAVLFSPMLCESQSVPLR